MRFSCESCGSQYMISDDKVGPGGVKVRCKKCGNVVLVKRASAQAAGATPAPAPRLSGVSDAALDRELGSAFDQAFGGAEAPAPEPEPAPESRPSAGGAEAISDWYVAIKDAQVGPLPAAGVRGHWEAGDIGPDTLAWRPGMGDWVPLSTIPEMADYLAPVARGGKGAQRATPAAARPGATGATAAAVALPSPAASQQGSPASGVPAGSSLAATGGPAATPQGPAAGEAGWKPAAASALAALASEEIAARDRPTRSEALPAGKPGSGSGSLVDRMDLPEGGVDPTNIMPLNLKGMDPAPSAEPRPRASASAPEPTEIRRIKSSARKSVLATGIGLALVFAAILGGVIWYLTHDRQANALGRPEAQPEVAQAVPPSATPAPPAAPPAATASTTPAPGAPTGPTAALPSPAVTQAPTPAPAPSAAAPSGANPNGQPAQATAAPSTTPTPAAEQPPPQRAPERVAAAPQREPARATTPRNRRNRDPAATRPPPRVAKAERRPAEALPPAREAAPVPADPPRRKPSGDPLLDVGDEDIDRELASGPKKRSVYVPPAIGSDLPESVSVSQINEAVVGQKAALVRCIDAQKAADSETRGTLRMRWTIQGDGSVRDVRVLSDEFARQPIASCMTGVVRSLRFPRTRTTGQVVDFPFKF